MNAKKSKKLRKFARDSAPDLPGRRLVIGKEYKARVPLWLNFKLAGRFAEELAGLLVKDLHPDSAQRVRMDVLVDMMDQYKKQLYVLYPYLDPDGDSADPENGEHEHHDPIRVFITVTRVTAINDPKSQRAVYRSTKRFITQLQRSIGYPRVSV